MDKFAIGFSAGEYAYCSKYVSTAEDWRHPFSSTSYMEGIGIGLVATMEIQELSPIFLLPIK